MSKHHVTTTINGEPVEYLCEAQQTMLDVLRDELNLTGSKEGCGSGDCGACTIIVDDKRGTREFRVDVAGVLARRAAVIALDRARSR